MPLIIIASNFPFSFKNHYFSLKVPSQIALDFFPNLLRVRYQKKAHTFLITPLNFTAEKCTAQKTVMVTMIGNCNNYIRNLLTKFETNISWVMKHHLNKTSILRNGTMHQNPMSAMYALCVLRIRVYRHTRLTQSANNERTDNIS